MKMIITNMLLTPQKLCFPKLKLLLIHSFTQSLIQNSVIQLFKIHFTAGPE